MKKILFVFIVTIANLCALNASANARGDINGDSKITISDVPALIDRLLTNDDYMPHYDTNRDGVFSISDVTELIDYLLTGSWQSGYVVPDNAEFYTVNGVTFAMVPVEGGTFIMGRSNTVNAHGPHQVTLSSFKIGLTEVTQELWEAVMGENPSHTIGANCPVDMVTWYQCMDFTARLRELTGVNFQLPTDAQWEFAARGGNLSQGYYYSGSDNIDDVAWYSSSYGSTLRDGNRVHPVGEKFPNELGIYDMSGNAYEWIYDKFIFVSDIETDPVNYDDSPNTRHLKRGGSVIEPPSSYDVHSVYYCTDQYPGVAWFADGLRLAIWP